MLFEIDRNPPLRVLRLFGALWLPLFLAIAGVVVWRRTGEVPMPVAVALGGIAAVSIALALAEPRWLRPVYVGLMVVTWPIGWVLSYVVLAILYFSVITPAGLQRRTLGKDPLRKRGSPEVATYWKPRRQPTDVERYFRQY
jgi:hypothetical protein